MPTLLHSLPHRITLKNYIEDTHDYGVLGHIHVNFTSRLFHSINMNSCRISKCQEDSLPRRILLKDYIEEQLDYGVLSHTHVDFISRLFHSINRNSCRNKRQNATFQQFSFKSCVFASETYICNKQTVHCIHLYVRQW